LTHIKIIDTHDASCKIMFVGALMGP
jgi:hypothetical protein